MNEHTKVALTKAGFAPESTDLSHYTSNHYHRVVDGWQEYVMVRGDESVVFLYVTEEQIPRILNVLATPAAYALTDEERDSLAFAVESVEFERFGEKDTTRHPDMKRIERTIRNLLARSESAPATPALAIAQRWLFSIENPSLAPLEIHAAEVAEVVRALSQGAPPEPTFTEAQVRRLTKVRHEVWSILVEDYVPVATADKCADKIFAHLRGGAV